MGYKWHTLDESPKTDETILVIISNGDRTTYSTANYKNNNYVTTIELNKDEKIIGWKYIEPFYNLLNER